MIFLMHLPVHSGSQLGVVDRLHVVQLGSEWLSFLQPNIYGHTFLGDTFFKLRGCCAHGEFWVLDLVSTVQSSYPGFPIFQAGLVKLLAIIFDIIILCGYFNRYYSELLVHLWYPLNITLFVL